MTRAALLFLGLAATACDAQDLERPPPRRERSFEIRVANVSAMAVGETLTADIALVDRDTDQPLYERPAVTATCSGADCAVSPATYGDAIEVTSRIAETVVVTVTATIDGSPPQSTTFSISYRTPTKLVLARSIADTPAGSAFSALVGERQRWVAVAADELGPLGVTSRALAATTDAPMFSASACGKRWIPWGATRVPAVGCEVEADTPTTVKVHATYETFSRDEAVTFAALTSVRSADVLRCDAPTLLPVDEGELPCEPVRRLAASDCATANRAAITLRLVLDDGSVALGGASYLSIADRDADAGAGPFPRGRGTLVGRFGDAYVSVPYDVDIPGYCPPARGW